jgi:hypothetical protein
MAQCSLGGGGDGSGSGAMGPSWHPIFLLIARAFLSSLKRAGEKSIVERTLIKALCWAGVLHTKITEQRKATLVFRYTMIGHIDQSNAGCGFGPSFILGYWCSIQSAIG